MSTWEPIETYPGGRIAVDLWVVFDESVERKGTRVVDYYLEDRGRRQWLTANGSDPLTEHYFEPVTPTHWMHRPGPPDGMRPE